MRLVNLEHNLNDSRLIAVAYVSVQSRSELGIINVIEAKLDAYDHTTLNAPVPVRSQKLSSVGPDQSVLGWVTAWEHPVL